jgi:hypothetical protein
MRVIAFIVDPKVVDGILEHLARAEGQQPPRGPPARPRGRRGVSLVFACSGLSISLQLVQDVVVARSHPVAGIDYPRRLQEFNEWFPSEEACQVYLLQLRWWYGFRCPACGGAEAWLTKRDMLQCSVCQRPASVTAASLAAANERTTTCRGYWTEVDSPLLVFL